ncbi:hypothetical protein GGS24DRAFT_485181 [Hypoxylon argillaceum]|nr:hypothetical protein GGS24DRAFT_485181 [Hypoxylon argillaceum]
MKKLREQGENLPSIELMVYWTEEFLSEWRTSPPDHLPDLLHEMPPHPDNAEDTRDPHCPNNDHMPFASTDPSRQPHRTFDLDQLDHINPYVVAEGDQTNDWSDAALVADTNHDLYNLSHQPLRDSTTRGASPSHIISSAVLQGPAPSMGDLPLDGEFSEEFLYDGYSLPSLPGVGDEWFPGSNG